MEIRNRIPGPKPLREKIIEESEDLYGEEFRTLHTAIFAIHIKYGWVGSSWLERNLNLPHKSIQKTVKTINSWVR